MTYTIELSPELDAQVKTLAVEHGKTVEAYLTELITYALEMHAEEYRKLLLRNETVSATQANADGQ